MAASRPRNLPIFTDEEVQTRLHILLEGIDQYNDGFYFEAHEIWEDLWMQSPWPIRRFLQGLIQMAAAFVHFARHEHAGTVRLLGHANEKLADFAPRFLNVDVAALLTEVAAARAALEELGAERFGELPSHLIPTIHRVEAAPKV